MMFYCMNTARLTEFGEYITKQRKARGWKQNDLAREARLDSGNLSKMLRGLLPVTHETAEAIADALKISVVTVKEKAGLRAEKPSFQRDDSVEYFAEKLDALPPEIRTEAIDALGAQLDVIYRVSGLKPPKRAVEQITEGYEVIDADFDFNRTMAQIKRTDPEFYQRIVDLINEAENGDE